MKSVLITGATGGIGKALVARFSGAGWRVHATDRRGALPLDVTSDASVASLREQIGVPDLVINNAGIGLLGPMAEIPDELIARQFDVNVRGLARVTRAFAPEMARRGNGRLINISSLAGVFTLPWFGAYAATKHAVEAVSDALRLELAPFGVDVVLIEPSIVGTGFVDAAVESLEKSAVGSTWREALMNTIARRALARHVQLTPEQVADVVFRAATVSRPKARYRVGRLASWLIRLSGVLPTRVSDAIQRAVFGLRSRQVRPLAELTA